MKTCTRCNQAKPLDDFKSDSRKPDGKASSCKACNAAPKVGELTLSPSRALVPVFDVHDPQAWAARIAERWRASVEAIFETGRLLTEAKATLPHGEFGFMCENRLPFSARTAQRLMAIANDPRLSNPTIASLLPASWTTIYELTTLSDDELQSAADGEIIHAEMTREDVAAIKPPRVARPMSDEEVFAGDVEQSTRDNLDGPTFQSESGEIPDPGTNSPLPNGARAIMGSRQEDVDSLDFFPTPPWATRALIESVFTHLERRGHCKWQSVWEPACGEGHMAEPLREYFKFVTASDIHNYGYGKVAPDFCETGRHIQIDWIITNPPFGDVGEAFVLKAIELAGTGVAMFMRVQWLDSIGRYERVFRDMPPTLIAFFAERVNLCKGRWDPDGSTATAYMWLVWIKGAEPRAPFWIPPGQREGLTKPDDVERFTQHPVKRNSNPASQRAQVAGPNSKAQCPTLPGCEAADDSQQRSRDFSNEDEAA